MNHFVNKVEPFFLSEDPFVQRFAIELLEDTYLPGGDTFLTGLKAVDRGPVASYASPILPNLLYMPMNEEGIVEVINRLNRLGDTETDRVFYTQLLLNADTDLLIQHSAEVERFIGRSQLAGIIALPSMTVEELHMKLADITFYMETEGYNQAHFDMGKRIIKELIRKEALSVRELQLGITEAVEQEEHFGFSMIFTVYATGELGEETVAPVLAGLFKDEDKSDLLFEETANALVKIGTDLVVNEVEKIALGWNTTFYSLDVLGRIKTTEAEKALLRLFDQADDLMAKTLIADNLCRHLSTDAIPKIERLIETGYEDELICLEESLYVNCVMNGIQHPKLDEWRHFLELMEIEMNGGLPEGI